MAITVDGIVYRNLEEQVQKNKEDIAALYEASVALSSFGIKVVDQVDELSDLPSVIDYKAAHVDWGYGDAYAIGTEEPYALYILTRANDNHSEDYWFEIGEFPVKGDTGAQGPQGETGPQGQRGATWTVGTTFPASAQNGDLFLYSTNSQVYQYNSSTSQWDSVASIKGSQGIQGPVGPRGIQGIQGPVGPEGPVGPVGGTFTVKSTLSSTSLLPDPDESPRNEAYLIQDSQTGLYHIWIIVEEDNILTWTDAGQFTGSKGEQGPVGPQGSQGSTGATGDAAIAYNYGVITTDGTWETEVIENTRFSRTPKSGDSFLAICVYGTDTYIGSLSFSRIVNVTSSEWTYSAHYKITGPKGQDALGVNPVDSTEIVFDSATSKFWLANDVSNKIAKALVTPMTAPASDVLVGINTSNAQQNIAIGSGLTLSGGTLSASGGGTSLNHYSYQFDVGTSYTRLKNICEQSKGQVFIQYYGVRATINEVSDDRISFNQIDINDGVLLVNILDFRKTNGVISSIKYKQGFLEDSWVYDGGTITQPGVFTYTIEYFNDSEIT